VLAPFPLCAVVVAEELVLFPCDCDICAHEKKVTDAISRMDKKFLNMAEKFSAQFSKIVPNGN